MLSPKEYFGRIAEQRRKLDIQFPNGFCQIVSISNFDKNVIAGSRCEVSTTLAAKGIIDGTQRLQTAAEVKEYEASCSAARSAILVEERASLRLRISAKLGG
jgi:hypothetical protein